MNSKQSYSAPANIPKLRKGKGDGFRPQKITVQPAPVRRGTATVRSFDPRMRGGKKMTRKKKGKKPQKRTRHRKKNVTRPLRKNKTKPTKKK